MSLPRPLFNHDKGLLWDEQNNRLLFFGGYILGVGPFATVYIYDIANDVWIENEWPNMVQAQATILARFIPSTFFNP